MTENSQENDDDLFSADDKSILEQNNAIRKKMLAELCKSTGIPVGEEDRKLALTLMKDLDASIYTRARVAVARGTEKGITNLTAVVGKALLSYHPDHVPAAPAASRVLPKTIEVTDLVPGEMDIGLLPLKVEDLVD